MNGREKYMGPVDHINIVVRDLEQSERFYCELLGFEVFRRARLEGKWIETVVGLSGVCADVAYIQPPGEGPRIELIQYRSPESAWSPECSVANTSGLRHIAFRVKNIDEWYARLTQAGVVFIGPPTAVPKDIIRHYEGNKRLCYFHDPDGVLLELAEYTPEA
jgi:catechol 2,3-dioxygenase-like lactoylglutathione lyase family enzyme